MASRLRCLIVEDGPVSRTVLEGFVGAHSGLDLVASVGTAGEAAAVLDAGGVDLVLLDVELPDGSGMNVARRLGTTVQFILTTASEDHAMDAFQYRAADYLLKPVGYRRFVEAIERARRLAQQ